MCFLPLHGKRCLHASVWCLWSRLIILWFSLCFLSIFSVCLIWVSLLIPNHRSLFGVLIKGHSRFLSRSTRLQNAPLLDVVLKRGRRYDDWLQAAQRKPGEQESVSFCLSIYFPCSKRSITHTLCITGRSVLLHSSINMHLQHTPEMGLLTHLNTY